MPTTILNSTMPSSQSDEDDQNQNRIRSVIRCNTGEYPRVWVPLDFSKAITLTQRVFRHGYHHPRGDTAGYPCSRVPSGGKWEPYQYPWYSWYPLFQVWSCLPIMTRLATL